MFSKGEGTLPYFPSIFLAAFRFRPFVSPLSPIWRDRYRFLFPRGTLGQFQIAEITEHVETNVRPSLLWGGKEDKEGWESGGRRRNRQISGDGRGTDGIPTFTKYGDMKDFLGENIRASQKELCVRDVN